MPTAVIYPRASTPTNVYMFCMILEHTVKWRNTLPRVYATDGEENGWGGGNFLIVEFTVIVCGQFSHCGINSDRLRAVFSMLNLQ
jgi:hypothetical protein